MQIEKLSSTLEDAIVEMSNNTQTINPTIEQQAVLDETKLSLLAKMRNGQKFHSVELRSFKEIQNPDPKNSNIKTSIEPDAEPILARGVLIKNLNENELTLAKEVFGMVVQNSEGTFLPIDLSKKDKAEIILEDVSIKFSNALQTVKKNMPYGIVSGGIISGVKKIGLKAVLGNITAKYVGGAIIAPSILPILGGMAVAGAAIGTAFAVSPLAEKIRTIRQAVKDKFDGDEMEIALNAVEKIDYTTIQSTERSNLLPNITKELEERAIDTNRKFEKKAKLR